MEVLRENMRVDKRVVVASVLQPTEGEARAFQRLLVFDPSRGALDLSRPRLGEDAEDGSARARLACRHGAIDSLAREVLVPRRRPLLAVEIAREINQKPIPLLPGKTLQLPARDGIELDNPWGDLAPGGAGYEHHGKPQRETAPSRPHTMDSFVRRAATAICFSLLTIVFSSGREALPGTRGRSRSP